MTTTAAAWRHVEAEAKGIVFPGDVPGGCIRCLWDDAPEPCRAPTPDPASPCGYPGDTGTGCLGAFEHDPELWGYHTHQPTLCLVCKH
ncbi:MAG: hypothetical protein ACH36H_13250, partial [Candidatus Nanopelagicales bacterium]